MTKQVRVRFAPSPTGYLHVGGARTALFNWLFARKTGGKFILRIEDTDLARSTQESVDGLLRDLKWLNIDWDEGPEKGGDYGPYFQGERQEIYKKKALELVEAGLAYYCFCTDEELEAKKQIAEAEHKSLHYDGTCRNLSSDEVKRRLEAGEQGAIRLRVPDKDYFIDDIVRDRVEWKAGNVGDFIILRSNGMPVYNFAVTVDDALMKITHVIRAEEHLSNTLRQLIIYEAFGVEPPKFAHASLILGADKSKLSKRHGATSVGQYAEEGFLPEALVNFLALLGWNEGNDREIYTVPELIEAFSIERLTKAPGVFDKEKLLWLNGHHLRNMPPEKLVDLIRPVIQAALPEKPELLETEMLVKLLEQIQVRMTLVSDAADLAKAIYVSKEPEDEESINILEEAKKTPLFDSLIKHFETCEWNKDGYNTAIKESGKEAGVKGKNLYMPLRLKLTGEQHGSDLVGLLDLLGREEVLKRLKK
ncbi:MAG: glutamate--tRNA ligase [Candidatus Riflebacteria bacterium]|nr:glutamate--tRNA ligase [Candidatus Riflebacteria bacterium]